MKTINSFFLCCGRDDLLQQTLHTFVKKVVEINNGFCFKFFLYDDSGSKEKQNLIRAVIDQELKGYETKFLFSEKNLGQSGAVLGLLNGAGLSPQDYVFFCEEDFEFVQDISIQQMIESWEEKTTEEIKIRQVVLLTDAFEKDETTVAGLIRSRKNLIQYESDFFVQGTNQHRDICKVNFGGGSTNDDYCFHPHLTKFEYMNVYTQKDITEKSDGEYLIGRGGLSYCKLWLTDKIYAHHIGHYRYYSVFPGARVRSKVSANNHARVTMKKLNI